ncbi:MAG: leucine-rich repeat domain-containing protein, partial [Clostridiales bacterium]|nr:leucine-rich repeat domain-containing protein [Clostridiales bacterium]
MKDYELTPLEREVFAEMAVLNNTEPEMIYKTCIHNNQMYRFHYFGGRDRPPLTDISPLAKLRGLMRVELYQCNVRDLSPLAEIPTLEDISISGGSELLPCDFTPLKRLTGLFLHYDRCTIPKVTGLPLKIVYLSQVDSLEGLESLDLLTKIDLHESHSLSDLSPLATCPNLEELSAVDTAVSNLTPLAGHPSLQMITLSSTPVTDVSPLATIPTLEMIWLYGTAVE